MADSSKPKRKAGGKKGSTWPSKRKGWATLPLPSEAKEGSLDEQERRKAFLV